MKDWPSALAARELRAARLGFAAELALFVAVALLLLFGAELLRAIIEADA